MRLSQPDTHCTAESTEAMQIKHLAQGHNIQMPGFKPLTSVSRNRHSNHMTNILTILLSNYNNNDTNNKNNNSDDNNNNKNDKQPINKDYFKSDKKVKHTEYTLQHTCHIFGGNWYVTTLNL